MPPRPPPVIGSGTNVLVLTFGAPLVSPIILDAVWSIIPLLDLGIFDPLNLVFTGNNLLPIAIDALLYPLNLQDTLYLSATATFSALPISVISSAYGIDEDPQYGSGQISLFDAVTGFRFGFILTNARVYALYERDTTDLARAFQYLVPIASRTSGSINAYALAVSRALRTVTWIIDGATALTISSPGAPIDSKFLVNGVATIYSQDDFPLNMSAELGILAMPLALPACQLTLFDQCNRYQSLQNANQMVCTLGPIQVNPFLVDSLMSLLSLAVYRVNHIYPPCPGI